MRQNLILVPFQRDDVVSHPKCLHFTPLGGHGCFQLLHFFVCLRQRFAGRTAVSLREAVPIYFDNGVQERRQQFGMLPGGNKLDDVRVGDGCDLELGLHPVDRIGSQSRKDSSPNARAALQPPRAPGGSSGLAPPSGTVSPIPGRCSAAGPEGTEPVDGVISRRADARYSAGRSHVIAQADRQGDDQSAQEDKQATAICLRHRSGQGVLAHPAFGLIIRHARRAERHWYLHPRSTRRIGGSTKRGFGVKRLIESLRGRARFGADPFSRTVEPSLLGAHRSGLAHNHMAAAFFANQDLDLRTIAARLEPPARRARWSNDFATDPVSGFQQPYAMRWAGRRRRGQEHNEKNVVDRILWRAYLIRQAPGSLRLRPSCLITFCNVPFSS